MGFSYNLILTFQLAFLLLLVSFLLPGSTPLSITTDKEALISFKSQLVVHKLPNPLSTWDENLSPCNWTGVSCDDHRHRVIGLNLSGLRMAGSITPHLSNLSFLRSLELQNNQLSGNLPHHLGNLFRLTTLNLSFNSIVGVIPPNISRCQHLRVLDLMQNKISGKVPLQVGLLTHLQVLNLAGNYLSGDIPSSLPNISSLVHLNLGTNRFSGPIPNDLARLTNLEFLDLTINNLTEYGYGVKPSKAGDVYSYGIIVLELFTGRSPTLEMFTAGLSIKSWVQKHFPISVEQVIDLELLQQMNDISRDEDYSSKPQSLHDCMITILGVGLSCAAESVDARISIRDALTKLKNVEQILQKHDFVDCDGF